MLIHAGTKDDADGWASPGVREELTVHEITYGAIIAVVERVTCHRCVSCCADRWGEPGAWHWVLEDVTALPEPISATGRLRLWRPEPEAVVAALAAPQRLG
ncbi:hypothetical protein OG762_33810 [Streptomyces sp. NBC_01136]|uniref:hypothetical protein n=1 Tax=unclassified Streptomyces TaxID=2593676 RepID=UPI0032500829|nr:hypothetical protein OG762_33810 [Streptomyces sp. NBC_01136]